MSIPSRRNHKQTNDKQWTSDFALESDLAAVFYKKQDTDKHKHVMQDTDFTVHKPFDYCI